MDYCFPNYSDFGDRTNDHCGIGRHWNHRFVPQGDHFRLFVFLPGDGRDGERIAFAEQNIVGFDAQLQRVEYSDILETAGTGLGALFIQQFENRHCPWRGRRHCGGATDRHPIGSGGATVVRFILWANQFDLGCVDHRFGGVRIAGDTGRPLRKEHDQAHGLAAMNIAGLKPDFSISGFSALCLAGLATMMLFGTAGTAMMLVIVATAASAAWALPGNRTGWLAGGICCAMVMIGSWTVLRQAHQQTAGTESGVWIFVISLGFLAWRGMGLLSVITVRQRSARLLLDLGIPALFGAWLIFLWEALAIGFSVPRVLLPAPSMIGGVFGSAGATLVGDFHQTFIRAVLPGFIIGCTTGFVAAVAADRVPFLQRGLLPLGNLVSAIPIVGIAPIMVMWFGFDWQSKAAVVAIMTFFPMLVNTLTGLRITSKIECDLLHTYASGYWRELFSLRLPNAMPFILNAFKINSTLAMIGAIVAEFFGTPIVGMGFRISTEVGRMNIDMVWATIAVAALAGSLFYGLFAVVERVLIFWHPSIRKH